MSAKEASWLDTYLHEVVSFPNSKNDDQVNSTVFALAWHTSHVTEPALLQFTKNEAAKIRGRNASQNGMIRVWVPPGCRFPYQSRPISVAWQLWQYVA